MPRPATGQIVERHAKDGRTYRGLRFTAKGRREYVSLGPVTLAEAERELRHALADVKRGIWQPARTSPRSGSQPPPTFHEYAEDWWLRHERRLRPKTQPDNRWRLEKHLLRFFEDYPLDAITFDAVERYIAAKLAEADRQAHRDRQPIERRAMIATLVFAWLRIGELCGLRWRDVDLNEGRDA